MIKKFLHVFLIILALLALLAVGWACEAFLGWPEDSMWLWPVSPIMAWLLLRVWRSIWVRYRAHQRLKEQQSPEAAGYDVDEDWRAAVREYSFVTGGTQRNPLTGRRLHFVMGLSGSGKTSFLMSSGNGKHVASSLGNETNRKPSCHFNVLESGIAVELSGKHIDPGREPEALEGDWRRLLSSIRHDVSPGQCSAIVVCLSIQNIIADYSQTLRSIQLVRKRASDLMMVAGHRLPIYVMLTKLDQLPSINALLAKLPEALLAEPAGVLVETSLKDIRLQIPESIAELARFIPWLEMRAAKPAEKEVGYQGLISSAAVRDLQVPLESILFALFESSSFSQAPIYRGIFLSSALNRLKQPLNTTLTHLGPTFGSQFFDVVLTEDRVSEPFLAYENWRARRKKLLAIGGYCSLMLALIWLLAGYFLEMDRVAQARYLFPITMYPNEDSNQAVDDLKAAVPNAEYLESSYKSRWRYFFPFRFQTMELERKIQENFLSALENQRNKEIESLSKQHDHLSPRQKAMTIEYFSRRYNLMREAAKEQDYTYLSNLPVPNPRFLPEVDAQMTLEESLMLNRFYLDSLIFDTPESLHKRLVVFGHAMIGLLNKVEDLDWILDWADVQLGVRDSNLSEFWSPTAGPSNIMVRGAFTEHGKMAIQQLLDELNDISPIKDFLIRTENEFIEKYRVERVNAWALFVRSFSEGRKLLKTQHDWVLKLSTFNSDASPYHLLQERIINEFSEDKIEESKPGWVAMLETMKAARHTAPDSVIDKIGGKFKIMEASGQGLVKSSQGTTATLDHARALLDSGNLYRVYLDALAKSVADAITGSGKASNLAADYSVFGRDPKVTDSAFVNALNAEQRLESTLNYNHHPEYELAWLILKGELDSTMDYAYKQAACKIQAEWQASVMWAANSGTTDADAYAKVLGDQGALWKFTDSTALPFLLKRADSFEPMNMNGWALAWDSNFLSYANDAIREKLTRAAQSEREEAAEKLYAAQDEARLKEVLSRLQTIDKDLSKYSQSLFSVIISTQPVRANLDASTQPYGVTLSLECSDKTQQVKHLNFALQQTLQWSPKSCGDTQISILIGDATMTRRWPGGIGFTRFLEEYLSGEKTYKPEDFAPFDNMLTDLGVKKIDVAFNIDGGRALLDAYYTARDESAEQADLEAEKLRLERAKALRDQHKLSTQLDNLSSHTARRPVVPAVAAQCELR